MRTRITFITSDARRTIEAMSPVFARETLHAWQAGRTWIALVTFLTTFALWPDFAVKAPCPCNSLYALWPRFTLWPSLSDFALPPTLTLWTRRPNLRRRRFQLEDPRLKGRNLLQ